MNTTSLEPSPHPQSDDLLPQVSSPSAEPDVYRAVSRSAVASLVLGVLGLTAFATPWLTPISLIGMVFAGLAFRGFRIFPDELVGKPIAQLGLAVCSLGLLLAPAWHAYVYATEVPEGYTRVSFSSLMSPTGQADVPPELANDLDGQPVFIAGYIHPSSMDTMMAKRFVIVPDLGTCCFGGQPPLTHMIEVTLTGEQYATKNLRKKRLAGTLHVTPKPKHVDGLQGVYYQLRADILK